MESKEYAFSLIDGRVVIFAGRTEREAFNTARRVHGAAVEQKEGEAVSMFALEKLTDSGIWKRINVSDSVQEAERKRTIFQFSAALQPIAFRIRRVQ